MRIINLVVLGAILAVTCGVAPGSVSAQDETQVKSDLLLRVKGPVSIGPVDTMGTVWVIGNNATILGTVRELVVIGGAARIDGTVQGNMVLINGTATLGPAARIGKDVLLYRSTITSLSGARIAGTVHNELGVSFGARALWLLWLSVSIAVIVAGLVLGYVASDSLARVADGLRSEWKGALGATLIVIFGLPFAAVISFMTGIGFVLGFFILFVLIPFLSLVGYLIAGTSLGRAILGVKSEDPSRLFTAIAVGILVMQAIAIIPGLGGLVVLLSSQIGVGALVYRAWRRGHSARLPAPLIVQPA